MERWLAAVARCVGHDGALASEVARAAQLVKGYGDVRRRMTALFDDLLETAMAAADHEAERADGFTVATDFLTTYRRLVLQGPDGEARARRLAADLRARLEAKDYAAARALLADVAA